MEKRTEYGVICGYFEESSEKEAPSEVKAEEPKEEKPAKKAGRPKK